MKKYLLFIIIPALLLAQTANAALSFVKANQTTGVTVTSLTVNVTTTAGDLLVVTEGANTGGVTNATPTDSGGNSYLFAASSTFGTGQMSMYYVPSSTAIGSTTCKFSGTIDTTGVCTIFEISGAAASSPLDTTSASGTASSVTNASSGAFTTTNANDILIFATRVGANQTTYTAGSGYTIPANATSVRGAMEYQIVSATQSGAIANITYGTATANNGIFGAFKQAAAAAASGPTPYVIVTSDDW